MRTYYELLRDDINNFVDGITPLMEDPMSIEYASASIAKRKLIVESDAFVQMLYDTAQQPSDINPSTEEEDGFALVQFWFAVLIIKLHASLAPDELVYDNFDTQFEEALEHAERAFSYISKRGKKMTTSMLPINRGIPVLFWVAWKCRDPILRRRAADLLRASHKTYQFECEYCWVAAIEKIIELENDHSTISDSTDIDDARRVYAMEVIPDYIHQNGNKEAIVRYKVGKSTSIESSPWAAATVAT